MPLTKEDRIANLAKARAAKLAKAQNQEEKSLSVDEILSSDEKTPSTVTTEAPSHEKQEEITLETLDGRFLEICIADICWRGKEITITHKEHQAFVAKGNPEFKYIELVREVARILTEGGYKFHKKGVIEL